MKFFTVILMSIWMVLGSCNTKKEAVKSEEYSKQTELNLIEEGFSKGTIIGNKEGLCDFVILDDKTDLKLDPINFHYKQFKNFRVIGKTVFYKYRQLRRANRCTDIQPIELLDIRSE